MTMKHGSRWLTAIVAVIVCVGHLQSAAASIAVQHGPRFDLDDFPLTTPPAGMGILQGLAYMSLLASVGTLWFRAFCVSDIDRRTLKLSAILAAVTVVLHVILVPYIRVWEIGESSLGIFNPEAWRVSPWASSIRALGCLVVGLPLQLWFAQTDMGRARNRRLLFLGGLIALGSLTVVGHTANLPPTWLTHGSDFIHGMGAAFWFGGILALVMYLKRAFEVRGAASQAGVVVYRFSQYALISVLGLAASGVAMTFKVKSDPLDITGTPFGKVLLVKLLLVVIPVGLAAYNRFRLLPNLDEGDNELAWQKLRQTVVIEALVLIAIVAVTGFLVLQNPIS